MNMNFDNYNQQVIREIISLLDKNSELYLVGGFLRDKILGKESLDMDFIVRGKNAVDLARDFADKTGRYFILLDEVHEIARVVDKDKLHYFDFARCENDDIEHDLKRRDLTINAVATMLYPDIKNMDILDGLSDINNKIIRAVSEKNLVDDPLRILRIFRFASTLDFEIDDETLNFAQQHAWLIQNVAKERILAELLKFFEGKNSAKYLELMKENGLLYELFDILKLEEEVPPNTHHHLKLIDHSIETVHQIELMLPDYNNFIREKLESYQAGTVKYISLLKLSALLHDVGKHSTWTIEETGRHRFINHDSVGAELLKPILKNMKFSKFQIKYITTLVKNHIYPSQLSRESENINIKAVQRMFRKLEGCTIDIIILAMADRLSAQGPAITKEMTENNLKLLRNYLNLYEEYIKTEKPLPKLLDGNEVSGVLGIKKDKRLGEILQELHNAQLSGDINTKDEAIEFIKNLKIV